ncbi:MAG: glutathione S-transferase family protein [Rhodobacteraceae bacterium]|nr:glutathione S-transferase family protein [Paracoccaceae bacterium]
MGLLVDGKWVDQWYDTKASKGHFKRKASHFRNWITADGSAGPSGVGGFKAEAGRYHLYISNACPWAHRTMIFRSLKGLEEMIDVSVVHPYMGADGWTFATGEGVVPDPINNVEFAHQIYTAADAGYTGRVTVPILWDKAQSTIVSNESSEIIRMFNTAFDGIGAKAGDCYPEAKRAEIDGLNERIYSTVNNGVYKAGFATTQAAYEEAVVPLFESLAWLEGILAKQRYLTGAEISEADWRLFTTLIRFDPVYVGHFKCNLKRIQDYPALSGYVRDLFQQPGVAKTVNMAHIKNHYYGSHESVNPTLVVPLGPEIDNFAPHGREAM